MRNEQVLGSQVSALKQWIEPRELAVEYGGSHAGILPAWLRDGGAGCRSAGADAGLKQRIDDASARA